MKSRIWKAFNRVALGAVAMFAGYAGNANAALLGVNPSLPDLQISRIIVDFQAGVGGGGTLTASSTHTTFGGLTLNRSFGDLDLTSDPDGSDLGNGATDGNVSFNLSATISALGAMTAGSFSVSLINADVNHSEAGLLTVAGGPLLSGALSDFGFAEDGGGRLEFVASIAGVVGQLVSATGFTGDADGNIGIILLETGFDFLGTGFAANFGSTQNTAGDGGASVDITTPVPVGSPLLLMVVGLLGLGVARRRLLQ